VRGLADKPAIDATNAYAGRNQAYESLAHEVNRSSVARSHSPTAPRVERLIPVDSDT
jgi:hypothetical protein